VEVVILCKQDDERMFVLIYNTRILSYYLSEIKRGIVHHIDAFDSHIWHNFHQ